MNDSEMLKKMCHQTLSDVDVKAICKSRGFSAQEAASRALFENFFLSEIGVESALASLTEEEIILLHLLSVLDEAVDVAFFARIYGESPPRYGTFTQRYRGAFNKVKASLVRKGVLLFAEAAPGWRETAKMERWRFRFPQQFQPFLPPVVKATKTSTRAGELRADVPRRKLMGCVGGKTSKESSSSPHDPTKKEYALALVDGEIRIGSSAFSANRLSKWQQACWESAVPYKAPRTRLGDTKTTVSPAHAAVYALAQLGENEWICPDQLAMPLKVFCDADISGEAVCDAGWQWGCIVRNEVDGEICYRLPEKAPEVAPDPDSYLDASGAGRLVLNLETVPYESLEHLVRISDMRKAEPGQARLIVVPNLVKIGAAPEATLGLPLVKWLRTNVPAFGKTLKTVEQRKGKHIIHEDLLIARVTDLVLKVQIERSFKEKVVSLHDEYIAFPLKLLTPIEKLVTKSGHVIRTVRHDE